MAQRDLTELIQHYGDILGAFFNHVSDMFFLLEVVDGTRFRYVLMNPSAMRVAGFGQEAYGKLIEEMNPPDKAEFLNNKYRTAVTAREPVLFTSDGDIVGESVLTPIFNAQGECTHVFSVTRDITDRKRLEQKLEYMAYHDMLTGLPNRRLLMDRLQQAIAKEKRTEQTIALLFLDCDQFKAINDTWGHDVGDQFLQVLAKRLKACVRDMDTVARIGGDEFVLMLTSIELPEDAAKVAQRVLEALQQPWQLRQQRFSITSSIGISLYPRDGEDPEQLLHHADRALYQAKTAGRNQYRFFTPSTE
jgi:diguanylate cyclase (GGDEF)-like protein/PAS domain S-box-containing protein